MNGRCASGYAKPSLCHFEQCRSQRSRYRTRVAVMKMLISVKENPGTSVVRGWVDYRPGVNGVLLTAHSVARGTDGQLFDITRFADERVRDTRRFVPHLGGECWSRRSDLNR